jgi:CRP-like cAMP-binding protein
MFYTSDRAEFLWVQHFCGRKHTLDISILEGKKVDLIHHFALFRDISPGDCTNILSASYEKHFLRRQTVFFEGDPIRKILLLINGSIKETQVGQNGTAVILRLSGLGEIVGPLGSATRGEHSSTAHTLELSTVLAWDKPVFDALSQRYPSLKRNTARILEERLQELEERFREIATEKVAPRLSNELVRLLHQVGRRVNGHVEIGISREELAQLTGTTLFTVSRVLCQWETLGVVSSRREVVLVRNLPALMELAVTSEPN